MFSFLFTHFGFSRRGRFRVTSTRYRIALRLAVWVVTGSGAAFAAVFPVRTASEVEGLPARASVTWRHSVAHGYVDNRSAPFTPREVDMAWEAAREVWGGVDCAASPLLALETSRTRPADDDETNTVAWVSFEEHHAEGFEVDRPAVTLAAYEVFGEEARIVEADVYLNLDHTLWNEADPRVRLDALVSVFTHELGHVLGFLHPCEARGAGDTPDCGVSLSDDNWEEQLDLDELPTMWPGYHESATTLSQDEAETLCALYPRSDPKLAETSRHDAGFLGERDGGVHEPSSSSKRDAGFGASCERPSDCDSGLCLVQGGLGVCAKLCDDSCPGSCTVLDGSEICEPEAQQAEGCGVQPMPPSGRHSGSRFRFGLAAVAGLFFRRTVRRGPAQRS